MRFVFRADASVHIGSGHIMRCLALADWLQEQADDICFICADIPATIRTLLRQRNFQVFSFGELFTGYNSDQWNWKLDAECTSKIIQNMNPNWLIVDSYRLGEPWEHHLRLQAKKIMVIDDLANRHHDCNILLDQNYFEKKENRYQSLVPEYCHTLVGPQFAILRREFFLARKSLRERKGRIRKVLVSFGGSDPTNETLKTLEAFRSLLKLGLEVDVVVGAANPHKEEIAQMCSTLPRSHYYCQIDNMAEKIAEADLAIGAGGSSHWERCFLGLPSITIIVAENQAETTESLARYGAIWNLGYSEKINPGIIADAVVKATENPGLMVKMSELALLLMGEMINDNPYVISLLTSEKQER